MPGATGAAGGGATQGGADPALQAIGDLYQRGFQSLGAQSLEGLDQNQLGFLSSGGSYLGYDPTKAQRQYESPGWVSRQPWPGTRAASSRTPRAATSSRGRCRSSMP